LAGLEGTVARLARQLLARCRDLTAEVNALEVELGSLVRRLAPALLAVPGCRVLGAAMILGETGGVGRVPVQGCLRPVHRHRPDPGVVR
jgi:transposase